MNVGYEVHQRDARDLPDLNRPVQLIWTDPPFGIGKVQSRGTNSYKDGLDIGFVSEALCLWSDRLADDGVLCVCLDYRNVHRVAVDLEGHGLTLRGEVIWHFGLGRPCQSWWPVRHNTILTFTRSERHGTFYADRMPTEERRAPKAGYVDPKPVGSVWWHTMSNTDPERCGYPNQKPLAVVEPFVLCHSDADDLVVDPFMGSGTTGVAAMINGRNFLGCDTNPEAVSTATQRLAAA